MSNPLNEWSSWLKEGHFVSFQTEGVRYYEHILNRDLAHWEYDWPETINADTESGAYVPEDLEITRGYQRSDNTNQIWQMIFGIDGQVFVYIELPTDLHRHGIPKDPKPTSSNRKTSHFTEWMSPFYEPSWCTEHFMIYPWTQQIALEAYNPHDEAEPDLRLNFFMAKLLTERIGTERYTEYGVELEPTQERFTEALDKLYRRVIPHRPLPILPVQAPASVRG
jgi:hypothetical protein